MKIITAIRAVRREGRKGTASDIFRLRISLIIISLIMPALLIRPLLSEYLSSDLKKEGILTAARISGENARYHYLLGLIQYNTGEKEDIEKAADSYLRSLESNPLNSKAWLSLARAYSDLGLIKYSEHAVKKAVYFDKNNPNILWEAGVFYLLNEKFAEAVELFKRYILMVPDEQERVYSTIYMLKAEPGYVLENLIPNKYSFYKRYLNFLMSNSLLRESLDVWDRMKALKPKKEDYLMYCDFLINAGELSEALKVWRDFIAVFEINAPQGASDNIIWNGDFESPVENGGFDWRVGRGEGVRVFKDNDIRMTGYASISASFDGTSNPDIYIVRQVALIEPGRNYKLSGYIKTDNITTRNGIFLEITGYKCGFAKRSETITGTNFWKKVEMEFRTPDDCAALYFGARREQSQKFDNKISGDVWIDSLWMREIKGS